MRGNIKKRMNGHEMYLHTLEELRDSFQRAGLVIEKEVCLGHQEGKKVDTGFGIIFSGSKIG